jgi:autotransporter-associated beta strand protein
VVCVEERDVWKDPVKNTPSIVQVDFGAYGQNIPGDGEAYCGPTSMVMGLYWLRANGFTQVVPAAYDGQEDPVATNLERVIAGLAQTSSVSGTGGDLTDGVSSYLSACGIAPDQYMIVGTDSPNLAWLGAQLAPNVADNPDTIVLANFSVGWYSRPNTTSTDFQNNGGHVLTPLTVDLFAGTITINNAYPASFENVLNQPDENPQTVEITVVPSGWTLPYLGASQDYSQVVSATQGSNGLDYAILWGGAAWAISTTALPSSSSYQLSTWAIGQLQEINTNGGILTVIAPLAGAGGFEKDGEGTLLLTNVNDLTGANAVSGGTLASTQASGTPFGAGPMILSGGGTLLLSPSGSAKVAIASGSGAACTIGDGSGTLQFLGQDTYVITIGGNSDGTTPNIARGVAGTLVIAAGAGLAELGTGQQVLVAGMVGNLPVVSNGIVAPFIVGQDNDAASAGAFLTYDSSAGFQAASTVSSASVDINQVQSDVVYAVVGLQTIDVGGAPQVAALQVNGGQIEGLAGSLLVGSQAAGDIAGVVMNGGIIMAGALGFGDAEGLIYTSDAGAAITSAIGGSAGLTVFGPGTLILAADSSTTLTGPVNVNSGTLIAASTNASSTGAGEVVVNSEAALEVTGIVGGLVMVDQSGTLFLNGGTVQGDVTIAPVGETSADPGGILQGGGTIGGSAAISGVIQSGPQAGLIEFTDAVDISGDASFFWRLQTLVDNTDSSPGIGWNALQFNSAKSSAGAQLTPISYFLDFSALDGDPDGGDPFWTTSHTWSLLIFAANNGTAWWGFGNFYYESGNFDLQWDNWTACLTWTPAAAKQSLADRRRARAEAQQRAQQQGRSAAR